MKRDPLTIIEQLFQCLQEGRPFSINELSKKTGIHCVTIKRYMKLIKVVREEPELEIIRTKHSVIIRTRKQFNQRK